MQREKKKLAALQEAINQTAEENNWNADNLAAGKITKAKKSEHKHKAQYGEDIFLTQLPEVEIIGQPFNPDENYNFFEDVQNQRSGVGTTGSSARTTLPSCSNIYK